MTAAAAWIRERWAEPMARYPVLLSLYLAIIAFAYARLEPSLWPVHDQASALTADLVARLLSPFAAGVFRSGQVIHFDGFSLGVIGECLGTLEMVIFAAFVLAYPVDERAKAWGLLIGPFVIYALNVLRLVTLVLVGRFLPAHFDLVHVYLWQGTMIAIVAVTWLGWLHFFARR